MRCGSLFTTMGAVALLAAMACAPAQTPSPSQREAKPPVEKVEEKPPAPTQPLDPREERRLVKDLQRDVAEYHRLLQEKRVEEAARYVPESHRQKFQDSLWEFVAKYKLQSADILSYQLFPESDGLVMAKVKVLRTQFEKYSVVPQKSEIWMTWEHRGDRWMLRPQEKM